MDTTEIRHLKLSFDPFSPTASCSKSDYGALQSLVNSRTGGAVNMELSPGRIVCSRCVQGVFRNQVRGGGEGSAIRNFSPPLSFALKCHFFYEILFWVIFTLFTSFHTFPLYFPFPFVKISLCLVYIFYIFKNNYVQRL